LDIVIVTPWFSESLNGGCEKVALQIAKRLSKNHSVHVFTTCSPSLRDHWGKHHKPRDEEKSGYTVSYFPCSPSDPSAFAEATNAITSCQELTPGVFHVSDLIERLFWQDNVNSPALLERLAEVECDRIILLPYLFGVINSALTDPKLAHQRSKMILMPCLHDEGFAYLRQVEDAVHNAAGLLLLSKGELEVAQKLYGPGVAPKAAIVGSGIEPKKAGRAPLKSPYLLCIGIRPGKGAELLVEAFKLFKRQHPKSRLQLVLVGQADADFSGPGIDQRGVVTESQKASLLAHCLALCSPSKSESFSRAMFEAWHYSRPVIVRGDCKATAWAVAECDGGWTATTIEEWAAKIKQVDIADSTIIEGKGKRGKAYRNKWGDWGKAIARIEAAISLPAPLAPLEKTAVHQLLAGISPGDAISNYAFELRDKLRQQGHPSEIYAEHCNHPEAIALDKFPGGKCEIFYHHYIDTKAAEIAMAHKGRKRLIYHNITPPSFIQSSRPQWLIALINARAQLKKLIASGFDEIIADSEYNAEDLYQNGADQVTVEPPPTPPKRWDISPDRELMRRLSDGATNLLFVGRIVENKCQHHLIETFRHFQQQNPDRRSRLILAGGGDSNSEYHQQVRRLAAEAPGVEILCKVSEAELAACYRSAHLYLSLSEHEGFGVPLIEAKQHGIPVLAFDSSAVGETIGDYAILFEDKSDLTLVAAIASALMQEKAAN